MGKIGRRRFALTLAAVRVGRSAGTLSTVFSCGSRWTAARSCSALCPTGDDDACPPGQRCFGGIPCEDGESLRDALERQRRLEHREMRRLALRREEEYADRFVCGGSYDEAAESCAAPARDGSLPPDGTPAASYCPDGSSGECPAGTLCYAAVPCPRSTHVEEPPLWGEVPPPGLLNSFLVTEPILLNSTATNGNNGSDAKDEGGWFASPRGESSSAVLGTVSSLLSFRYGSN